MTTSLHIHFAKPVNRLALAISLALALTACGGGGSDSTANPTPTPTPTPTPDPTPDPTPTPSSCVANPMGDTALYLRGGMNSWNAAEEYKFNYVCDHFELVTETDGDQSFKIGDAGWSATFRILVARAVARWWPIPRCHWPCRAVTSALPSPE